MGYFKNNYRCEKCNGSKFYIAFLDKELKITCVGCGKIFFEKTEVREKKSKRYDSTVVMISGKLDEIETKQNELIDRVEYLENKVEMLEGRE